MADDQTAVVSGNAGGRIAEVEREERDQRARLLNDQDRDGKADHLEAIAGQGRWTVQRLDESRGLYGDVVTTDSALLASKAVEQGREYRVLDKALGNDVAADYEPHYAGHNPDPSRQQPIAYQLEYSPRSTLEAEMVRELQAAQVFKQQWAERLDEANAKAAAAWTSPDAKEEAAHLADRAAVALQEDKYLSVEVAIAEVVEVARFHQQPAEAHEDALRDFREQRPLELQELLDRSAMAREPASVEQSYDGAEEIADAAYQQQMRDRADHVEIDDDRWEESQLLNPSAAEARAMNANSAAFNAEMERSGDHAQAEAAGQLAEQLHDQRAEELRLALRDFGQEVQSEVDALGRIDRGDTLYRVHEMDGEPQEVRSVDDLKGYTPDQLIALEADKVPGSPEAERRDAELVAVKGAGKVAEAQAMQADPEHQQSVRDLERAELQAVLDRRAELQARVDLHSEGIAAAVDRVRDDRAPAAEVHQAYEASAREYAQATQDMAAFQNEPSKDPAVVAKFRDVERIEQEVEQARQEAAHARIDVAEPAVVASAEERARSAQERLQGALEREGVRLPSVGERTDNTIEPPLSEEQIRKLTAAPKHREAEEELDANAAAAGRAASAAASVGEGHNQVRDQSAFNDAASKDKLVPEDVAAAFKREGQKYLDANDPKKVAFVDKGNRLQTVRTFDDQAVAAMIHTADARGWSEVKVTGDEAFRRKAWIEATARGIEVKGYEPTEKDIQRAEQLGQQTGRANAIEKNETIEAYRQARDGGPKDKRDAAREHPELTNAFALEAAARSFAKQRLAPGDHDRFVDRMRENIERDLAQGKSVPEVRRRQEQERRQDRGVER